MSNFFLKVKKFFIFLPITVFVPATAHAQRSAQTDLGTVHNFGEFLGLIFGWAMPITGGIAVLMFVYAGYLYMTSQGDTGKIDEAKEIILGVVVGVMLLFTIGILLRNVIGTLR